MERVTCTPADLGRTAAQHIAGLLAAAVEQRGIATLAVSGGSTPMPMFHHLSVLDIAWPKVHIFQVDERVAPFGSAARNLGQLDDLVRAVALPAANVHPMPVAPLLSSDTLAAPSRWYGEAVRRVTGDGLELDVVHLGLGDDGHTASWPPGDNAVLASPQPVEVVGPFNGTLRMTMTPRLINRARNVLWLVAAASKRNVLNDLLHAGHGLPAHAVTAERQSLFTDIGE